MKNKNEMCQFSALSDGVIITAAVVARMVGCSESAVKKVRNGFVGKTGRGKVCQQIILADQLLKRAIDLSVSQVAKVLTESK